MLLSSDHQRAGKKKIKDYSATVIPAVKEWKKRTERKSVPVTIISCLMSRPRVDFASRALLLWKTVE